MACSPRTAWVVLVLLGCGEAPSDATPQDSDTVDSDSDPVFDTDALDDEVCALHTWQTVGQPFLSTWCGPCHGPDLTPAQRQEAPPELILATEDDAYRWADRIRARALRGTPDMPPVGGPSADEIARMATYLDCLYRD